jgi:hypothetical protein
MSPQSAGKDRCPQSVGILKKTLLQIIVWAPTVPWHRWIVGFGSNHGCRFSFISMVAHFQAEFIFNLYRDISVVNIIR